MTTSTLDSSLELVANQYRREVIRQLRVESGGETTVDALLDRLYLEDGPENVPLPDRKLLAAQLHHVHLPKLAAHGLIEYEPETGSVRYQPDSSVEEVLESLPTELASVAP